MFDASPMMNISGSGKAGMNMIRLRTHDAVDESIKVFSNIAESHRLPKNYTDDFSFPSSGICVIKNLSEQDASLSLQVLRLSAGCLVARSNRRGAFLLHDDFDQTFVLGAGEALTLRADDHQAPAGRGSL